jgi:hypothetical protein
LRLSDIKVAAHLPHDSCPIPPELNLVIDAWDRLPEAVRAGIVAMVKASDTGRQG